MDNMIMDTELPWATDQYKPQVSWEGTIETLERI